MGSFHTFLCLFLVIFSYIISLSNAYSFSAGGKDGWVVRPSESYDSWSKRQRFIIGDSITFKYTQGVDSVLSVNKNDYDNCNINNPITKMVDGNSVFKLDKSGPFYFISGNKTNCDQGQKLSLVVISPKNHHMASSPVASPPAPAALTPAPAASSPVASPPAPAALTPAPAASSPIDSPPAPAALTPLSPEIPAMPSSPPTSEPGSEAPVPTSGTGGPVASASNPSGAPPPSSFAAAKLTPSVAVVASVWFFTSVALGSFVTTH